MDRRLQVFLIAFVGIVLIFFLVLWDVRHVQSYVDRCNEAWLVQWERTCLCGGFDGGFRPEFFVVNSSVLGVGGGGLG